MMTTIDSIRLREHANKNITAILDALNIQYTQRGPLYQARCPAKNHPGNRDNDQAFSWKEGVDHWICWTHGCDQEHGADVYGLVRSILQCSFRDATAFVLDTLSKRKVDITADVSIAKTQRPGDVLKHKPVSESILKYLSKDVFNYPLDKSLKDRGYDPWLLEKFQVGFWHQPGTYMNDRIIFPLRDHAGFLVGFTGRTIYPESEWERRKIKAKWIHGRHFSHWPRKGDELFTSSLLYNFHNAKSHVGDKRSLILVEGPLDGIKIEQAGIKNWSALLGVRNFSASHRTLLVSHGINELVLGTDPGEAGDSGRERISSMASNFFHIVQARFGDTDPGDTPIEEIQRVLA
jgi:hypothetical protein